MREFLEELEELGVDRDVIAEIRSRLEEEREEEIGTDSREDLTGTDANDQIDGRGGNDTILGEGGNDYLVGGAGNDELRGGDGHDLLIDTQGNNEFIGSNGDDVLIGGNGNDILDGEFGSDYIKTGGGSDLLRLREADGEIFVTDFDPENDRLEFIDSQREDLEIGMDSATNSVMISTDEGFKVVFLNQKEQMSLADFNLTTPSSDDQTLFDNEQEDTSGSDASDDDQDDNDSADNDNDATDEQDNDDSNDNVDSDDESEGGSDNDDLDDGDKGCNDDDDSEDDDTKGGSKDKDETDTSSGDKTSSVDNDVDISIKDSAGNSILNLEDFAGSSKYTVPATDPKSLALDVDAGEHLNVKITYIAPDGTTSVLFDSEKGGNLAADTDKGTIVVGTSDQNDGTNDQALVKSAEDGKVVNGTSGDDVLVSRDADKSQIAELKAFTDGDAQPRAASAPTPTVASTTDSKVISGDGNVLGTGGNDVIVAKASPEFNFNNSSTTESTINHQSQQVTAVNSDVGSSEISNNKSIVANDFLDQLVVDDVD